MSGSADAWLFEGGKKTWVSALFFITYLQVKGCQGHYTVLQDGQFAALNMLSQQQTDKTPHGVKHFQKVNGGF